MPFFLWKLCQQKRSHIAKKSPNSFLNHKYSHCVSKLKCQGPHAKLRRILNLKGKLWLSQISCIRWSRRCSSSPIVFKNTLYSKLNFAALTCMSDICVWLCEIWLVNIKHVYIFFKEKPLTGIRVSLPLKSQKLFFNDKVQIFY